MLFSAWRKRAQAKKDATRIGQVVLKMGLATKEQLTVANQEKKKAELIGSYLVRMGVISDQELLVVLEVQRKMRNGDNVSANVRIVDHHTETMRRTASSQMLIMQLPNTNTG